LHDHLLEQIGCVVEGHGEVRVTGIREKDVQSEGRIQSPNLLIVVSSVAFSVSPGDADA